MELITNKKARFNFELMDTYEAGIELHGFEVKALRQKSGSLEGAHVVVRGLPAPHARQAGGEAYVVGMHIPPYQEANTPKWYDPNRARRLLLTKKELGELLGSESKKGLTIVPVSVYTKNRRLKLSVAIARGKKKYDKRETIKKREADRDIGRTLKQQ